MITYSIIKKSELEGAHRLNGKLNIKNRICYLCGGVATTKDHVPSKNLFESPLPSNFITLPACVNCNVKFSKDEEWFRNQILAMSFSERGRRLWKNKALKALNRKPKLKFDMRENLIKLNDGKTAIKFSAERANKIIKKVIYGLFFHHFGQRIRDNLQWAVYLNPQNNLLEKYGNNLQFYSIQADAFSYAFGYDREKPDQSLWWLLFHHNSLFVVGITE